MKMTPTESSRFEDRLLEQLRQVVAEHPVPAEAIPRRRPRTRLVLVGAGCAASLAAVAFVVGSGGGTTRAYAVETRPNGIVDVSIRSRSDAAALQSDLEAAGIPAVVDFAAGELPACVTTPSGPTVNENGASAGQQGDQAPGWAELLPVTGVAEGEFLKEHSYGDMKAIVQHDGGEEVSIVVNPKNIESGERLVITTFDGTLSTLSMFVSSQGSAAGCSGIGEAP
jgi:hypothetical protein